MVKGKRESDVVWCLQEVSPTYFKLMQVSIVYIRDNHDTCIVCDSDDASFAVSKQNLFDTYCDANAELTNKNLKIAINEIKTIANSVTTQTIGDKTVTDLINIITESTINFPIYYNSGSECKKVKDVLIDNGKIILS